MLNILSVILLFTSNSWAEKKCPSYPWNSKLLTLANQSDWIISGFIVDEIKMGNKIQYVFKPTKIYKGDPKSTHFRTKYFIKSENISLTYQNENCEPTINLDTKKQFIIFSENRNPLSIMEATKENSDLVSKSIGSGKK